jgi:hypothetical protein
VAIVNHSDFLNEVTDFVQSFTKAEYKLWQDAYLSRDNNAFWSERERFNEFYYYQKLETDVRRPKNLDADWFLDAQESASVIRERVIFQIKLYTLSDFDLTAAIYLSSRHTGRKTYFELLLVSKVDSKLKIITSCLTDHEGYFNYHDGVEFNELKNPLKIVKFEPPEDPDDLKEYNEE